MQQRQQHRLLLPERAQPGGLPGEHPSPVDTVAYIAAMLAYVTAGNDIAAENFSAATRPLNQAAAYENQVTAAVDAYESSTGS